MTRYCVLLFLFYSINARCPAPFPGEHGPCMNTCGPKNQCSSGLWCCVTPCGGTVCKIPDLTNQATNNHRHKKETPLKVHSTPRVHPVQNHQIPLEQHHPVRAANNNPPTLPRQTSAPQTHQHPPAQGHQIPQVHSHQASPILEHIMPNVQQNSPVFDERLFSLLQPELLTFLDPVSDPLSNPGSAMSVLNHETNIVRQEFNLFQPPYSVDKPLPPVDVACPPGQPKVFCGYDPCSGKTCPVFTGSICVPDYCGDCRFKFTLATVDVTKHCHFNFNK